MSFSNFQSKSTLTYILIILSVLMQMTVTYHMHICMACSIDKQTFRIAFGTITEADSLIRRLLGRVTFTIYLYLHFI